LLCNIISMTSYNQKTYLPDGDICSALILGSCLYFRPHIFRNVFVLKQVAASGNVICCTTNTTENILCGDKRPYVALLSHKVNCFNCTYSNVDNFFILQQYKNAGVSCYMSNKNKRVGRNFFFFKYLFYTVL